MVLQVQIQSGQGSGLLAIVTTAIDSKSFGPAVDVLANIYETFKGTSLTASRIGPWNRTDTYTGAGSTAISFIYPQKFYSLQVVAGTGTPTAWEVVLELSLDNVTFTEVLRHSNTVETLGQTKWNDNPRPALFGRTRVISVTIPSGNFKVVLQSTPH